MKFDESEIQIIPASVSDAADILHIQKLAFLQQAVLYNDFTLPPLVQTLDELTRDFNQYSVLKALYNRMIVGSVRGRVEGDTCFIFRLMVHPDYQNRRIGTRLMQAIENKFGDVHRFELYTGHKSAKNLSLYAKLGYREFARKRQSDNVMLINLEKAKHAGTPEVRDR